MTGRFTGYVIVVGNPIDGIDIYGPFDRRLDANDWATENVPEEHDWFVVGITREVPA